MEALKTFDIEELLKRQEILDEKFDEKETLRKRNGTRLRVAYITELGELCQELKNEWNYWKKTKEEVNKKKVLEELSDLLHFYLSHLNTEKQHLRYKEKRIYRDVEMFNLEKSLYTLINPSSAFIEKTFAAMLYIINHVEATEKEFLQVHHEKWLKNMNERTKGNY